MHWTFSILFLKLSGETYPGYHPAEWSAAILQLSTAGRLDKPKQHQQSQAPPDSWHTGSFSYGWMPLEVRSCLFCTTTMTTGNWYNSWVSEKIQPRHLQRCRHSSTRGTGISVALCMRDLDSSTGVLWGSYGRIILDPKFGPYQEMARDCNYMG